MVEIAQRDPCDFHHGLPARDSKAKATVDGYQVTVSYKHSLFN